MGSLFTIVVEFRGGTYVSQHEAETPTAALLAWASSARAEKFIPGASGWLAKGVERTLAADSWPMPFEGLTNAWCESAIVGDDLALIHIVRTER